MAEQSLPNPKPDNKLKGQPSNRLSHGMSRSLVYRTWDLMRQRCNNPNAVSYPKYGAKGIRVCDRWALFANFYADMGDRPTPEHTLDRIDSSGHYEPSNCRWATMKEQQRNKKSNRLITIDGVTQTLAAWAEVSPVTRVGIARRINAGRLCNTCAVFHPSSRNGRQKLECEHESNRI